MPWKAVRHPTVELMREAKALTQIIRLVNPDLVHLHSSKAGFLGRLVIRGRIPTIFQPHGWSFFAVEGLVRRATLRWERTATRWNDAILCVSYAERVAGELAGIRTDWEVIPNGVNLKAFPPASDEDRARAKAMLGLEPHPVVVCVGRLQRAKGQDVLLSAWGHVLSDLPTAQLALVGDGPDRGELESLEVPRVSFVGHRDDVPLWLAAADVVVVPSRWEAGGPIAAREAMARGRAVVATRVGGAREMLGSRANSLVPPEDPHALAEAVTFRLKDPRTAHEEALQLAKRAVDHFDIRSTTERVAGLYNLVLERRADAAGQQSTVAPRPTAPNRTL
jgi:glycosyltransferase involved in cell wall biosynthesis